MAGRVSQLADPEFAQSVADLYVRGVSRDEMAETLGCNKDTIRVWIRDPRVQAHARRMAVERVQRIARRIDGEMDARLANVENWSLDELLKVRKEYLDRPLKIGAGEEADEGKATNEIAEAMDQNPEFAESLRTLIEGAASKER